jgi:hypothetical protein
MDVKTAFLNDLIEEKVYIEQPLGFEVHGRESHVCRQTKALYELKQAPRAWYSRIDAYLHPWPSQHPHAWTSPNHITHLHGLDEVSPENFPFPVDTSPIGRLVFFSRLVLQACVTSLSC